MTKITKKRVTAGTLPTRRSHDNLEKPFSVLRSPFSLIRINFFFVLFALILTLSACFNLTGSEEGSLVITLPAGSRAIIPSDPTQQATTYEVTATSGGSKVSITIPAGSSSGIMQLSPGTWDIKVEGYLPGRIRVCTGTQQVNIVAGQTNHAQIGLTFDNTDIATITATDSSSNTYPVVWDGSEYSVSVPSGVTSLTIAATAQVSDADISFNPTSGVISSIPGFITMTVSAGVDRVYTIKAISQVVATWSEFVAAVTAANSSSVATTITVTGSFNQEATPALPSITSTLGITLSASAAQTITRTQNGALINVASGGKLTLSGSLILDGNSVLANAAIVTNSGELTLTDNTKITGGKTGYGNNGGGVYINSGTFTMSGSAEISNNHVANDGAAQGGGVYVAGTASTTVTLEGNAKIIGNSTTSSGANPQGGGIYVTGTTGTINVTIKNNAEISNNSVETTTSSGAATGGGVYANSAATAIVINLEGNAKISNNSAISSGSYATGGGVTLFNNATFNMSAGEISGNKSIATGSGYAGGGGVSVSGGTVNFNMSGGEIKENTLEFATYGAGSGVYTMSAVVTLSGAARITPRSGGTYTSTGDNRNSIFNGNTGGSYPILIDGTLSAATVALLDVNHLWTTSAVIGPAPSGTYANNTAPISQFTRGLRISTATPYTYDPILGWGPNNNGTITNP
ncbi:hypothetical protein AGMMS50230_06050 [Spirochaetia bacterium]|nr:hypothetical protein AGMMS50230_06050 [Spirochaetia bacterium]